MTFENELKSKQSDTNTKKFDLPLNGILCIRDDGIILDANTGVQEVFGLESLDGLKGRSIMHYTADEDFERIKTEMKQASVTNKTKTLYLSFKRSNNEVVKTSISITPWLNDKSSNQAILVINVITIDPDKKGTNEKPYDKAVENLESFLNAEEDDKSSEELNQPDHWMFSIDGNGTCLSWNEYCEKFFGYSAEDVIGKKSLFDLMTPAQTGGTNVVLKAALTSEKEFRADIKFATAPGYSGIRRGNITITKCLEYQGKSSGYLCIIFPLDKEDEVLKDPPKSPVPKWSTEEQVHQEPYPLAQEAGKGDIETAPVNPIDNSSDEIFAGNYPSMEFNDFALVCSDGAIKYMTNNFVQQLGFSSFDEVREHKWFEFLTESPAKDVFKRITSGENPFIKSKKIPYKTKEGSVIETELQIIPLPDNDGQLTEALWLLNPKGPEKELKPPSGDLAPNEYEQALLQLNKDLNAVNSIIAQHQETYEMDSILKTTLNTISKTISVEFCGLFLIRGNELKLEYSIGLPTEYTGKSFDYPANVSDYKNLIDKINNTFLAKIEPMVASSLTIPITYQDELYGFISTASTFIKEFTKMDKDFINAISNQLAGTIKRQNLTDYLISLKNQYNEIYNNAPDIYLSLDINGKIIDCNERAVNELGYAKSEMQNNILTEILKNNLGGSYADFKNWLQNALTEDNPQEIDIELILKNGEQRFFNLKSRKVPAKPPLSGNNLEIILQDITKYEKVKSLFRSSSELMEQIFHSTNDIIIYIDRNKTILECNNGVSDLLGYNRDELVGKLLNELYSNDLLMERYFEKMNEAYSGKTEVKLEQVIRRKNGSMFVALVTVSAVKNSKGEITGMALYFNDITDHKRVDKELIEAKKLSTFFINVLSNDINNYNQCALSYLKLLNQTHLEGSQANYVKIIIEQLESSLKLSLNVRKLSKIKERRPELTSMDLNKALRATAYTILEQSFRDVEIGELDLKFNYPEGIYGVEADNLIGELFSNLFWNAIRHNTHDKKLLEINITDPQDETDDYWQIEITDNAYGIPDDHKRMIINSTIFNQMGGDNSAIGLSIINALIERYGGRLWIENRVKDDYRQGSIFKLLLKKTEIPMGQTIYGFGAHC
jgi:PAS domain S-box-containing protein